MTLDYHHLACCNRVVADHVTLNKRDALYWAAPGLAKRGLLRPEPWVLRNSRAAEFMYGDPDLRKIAAILGASHERALDYIRQAPVLPMFITRGRKMDKEERRALVFRQMREHCERGPKLADLMRAYRADPALRRLLGGDVLSLENWRALLTCSHLVPPSTLAQAIPEGETAQACWVTGVDMWYETMRERFDDGTQGLTWIARELGRALRERRELPEIIGQGGNIVGVVADFFGQQEVFNDRWTLNGAYQRALAWHNELADADAVEENMRQLGVGMDDEVSYAPLPAQIEVEGLTFVALRSPRSLIEEGCVMDHCVASYARDVVRGQSFIYSIRSGDVRVATIELRRDWNSEVKARQLRARSNDPATQAVLDAAAKFVMRLNAKFILKRAQALSSKLTP